MEILKPVTLRERRPTKAKRYLLKLFGGQIVLKRWIPRLMEFGRVDNPVVESWYQEVQLPSEEDLHFIIDSMLPPGAHPREKELMLKGARMSIDYLYDLMKRA